jgi:hypothetical protein
MERQQFEGKAGKEEVKVGTLLTVFILSALLTCIFNMFIFWLPPSAYCTQSVSVLISTPGLDLMGWPFVMLLLTAMLMKIPVIRKYLTTTNIVYLYIVTLSASYFSSFDNPWWWDIGMLLASAQTSESVLRYVPEFVAIPKPAAEVLLHGAGSVGTLPWNTLLPAVIWYTLIVAIFGGISISLVSIFRREWIDVERLPFPWVTVAYSSILGLENVKKREWPGRLVFILGFIAGLLTAIPLSGITLFPWFPDIYGWRTNTCGPGCHQLAPPDQPWHLGFAKHPPLYALMLLVPVHYLFSMVFYTVVLEVAVYIAYYSGFYTGIINVGFCGRNWCPPNPYDSPPLAFHGILTGSIIGIFVMTVFLERQYLANTLKVAFGKSVEEREEPMHYRYAWIIFILCFMLMILFFTYTGMSLWTSFAVIVTAIITWVSMTQVWGRLSISNSPCYSFTPGFIRMLVWPTGYGPPITSTDLALVPALNRHWIAHRALSGYGSSFYTTVGSYHMASLTGVNVKNVVKVLAVSLFTSMFFAHVMQVVIPGVYGGNLRLGSLVLNADIDEDGWWYWSLWNRPVDAPMSEASLYVAVGFIFMVVMKFLTTRILWLPDPLVTIVAWDWEGSLHGVWFVALVDGIVKYLVLKIGGSKLYEEKVVPFVGGFILGTALEVLVAAISFFVFFPQAV